MAAKTAQKEAQQAVANNQDAAEAMQEDPQYFIELDEIQDLGVSAADIAKLKAACLYTVAGVLMRPRKELMKIKGISEAKLDKIMDACGKLKNSSFMTGGEYLVKRAEVVSITTGSSELDKLLGGGIETMAITECFGEFRTGKTQLAHTLCVTSQLPKEMGGGAGKVAFIDTEGTFRPDRLRPIAERYGVDADVCLDNVVFARAYTHDHQMQLISEIAGKMVEEPFRLIIVDSMTALFRAEFNGRGELAERQQKIGRAMMSLQKLSEEFNVAVFITNQVVSNPDGAAMFVTDPKKPIGGHIMAHASTTRLFLRKGRAETRICKIYDSPNLPESEATFQISNEGITDAQD